MKSKPLCCDVCALIHVSILYGIFVMVLCSDPETVEHGAAWRWWSQYFHWCGRDKRGVGPKSRQLFYFP